MRYYYKDKNGNFYNYKEAVDGLITISEAEFNEHLLVDNKSKKQVEKDKIINKIIILKAQLQASDYKAIKYAEGELTEEEFAPIKEQRKTWRAEINKLEEELNIK